MLDLEHDEEPGEPMTPQQFKEAMQKIHDEQAGDCEMCHASMDALLCKVLRQLGYHQGVDVFEDTGKWYA